MENRWGNNGNSEKFLILGVSKSLQMVTAAMKLKDICSLEEKLLNLFVTQFSHLQNKDNNTIYPLKSLGRN